MGRKKNSNTKVTRADASVSEAEYSNSEQQQQECETVPGPTDSTATVKHSTSGEIVAVAPVTAAPPAPVSMSFDDDDNDVSEECSNKQKNKQHISKKKQQQQQHQKGGGDNASIKSVDLSALAKKLKKLIEDNMEASKMVEKKKLRDALSDALNKVQIDNFTVQDKSMLGRQNNTVIVYFPGRSSKVLSIALRAVTADGTTMVQRASPHASLAPATELLKWMSNQMRIADKTNSKSKDQNEGDGLKHFDKNDNELDDRQPNVTEVPLSPAALLDASGAALDKKQPQPSQPKGAGRFTQEEFLASLYPAALLDADGAALDVSQPNAEVWQRAATLVLGPHTLRVLYNVPNVVQMTPPSVLMVGHPATCADLLLVSCVEEDLQWEWAIGSDVVCTTRVFTPTEEHEGEYVRVWCCAGGARDDNEAGCWLGATASIRVAAAPPDTSMARWAPRSNSGNISGPAPASGPNTSADTTMQRWCSTGERACPQSAAATPKQPVPPGAEGNMVDPFRVVSYNILHDDYVTNEKYPFAPEEILALSYRKGAIACELLTYLPDIVLLQECGQGLFESFLKVILGKKGMEAQYTNKSGKAKEGNVIAFATNRFEALPSHTLALRLNADTLTSQHPDIAAKVKEHPHLFEALQQMTAVAAVVVLRDRKDENRHIIVANTHLYYHSDACHVRVLQVYMLVQAIAATFHALCAEGKRKRVHVILGGDFNSSPTSAPIELLTEGALSGEDQCWDKGRTYKWENSSVEQKDNKKLSVLLQEVFRAALTLPMTFVDTLADEPTRLWTTFSPIFKEIIDYIFVGRFEGAAQEEVLRTLRTIPLPSEADLKRDIGIPSAMHPSDHIPQVVDLAFATTAPMAATAVGVAGAAH